MDESRGPHQTWVGPQPASTETLPVPPPSHTNYAPRPNLASPGERVVLDATELSIFFQSMQCPISVWEVAAEKRADVGRMTVGLLILLTIVYRPPAFLFLHPFDLIGTSMEVTAHHHI